MVRAWLRRALLVRVTAWGNTRALVRQARLAGLICVARPVQRHSDTVALRQPEFDVLNLDDPAQGVTLEVSGPLALFRNTRVYGRAIAALVPRVAWCNRFEIAATCAIGRGGETAKLAMRSGAPIGAGRELARHDSRLEQRFERDFGRAAPDWDIVREPRPLNAAGTLLFPDFELIHRGDHERRWLLEIAGVWTPGYFTTKLRRLRDAGVHRLVLCIDERRQCSQSEFPRDALVVRYERRINPVDVLAILGSR